MALKLRAPVILFVFNRPDLTKAVFDRIALVQPQTFVVIADGPRAERTDEAKLCAETRSITEQITWKCDVTRHYSRVNMGCKARISSGITSVFDQFDRAIFLEDDCLPDLSFFSYCDELLERYKDDDRIGTINGSNFCLGQKVSEESFFFSKYPLIWGWASWRRVWKGYDPSLQKWPLLKKQNWLANVTNWKERKHWMRAFDGVHSGAIDTWDFQLVFLMWLENQLNIQPRINLIKNIGFRADATHTKGDSPFAEMAVGEMVFPLNYPAGIFANAMAEKLYRDRECATSLGRVLGYLGL